MPRPHRSCKTGRRARQHHGGSSQRRLIRAIAPAILFLFSTAVSYSQTLIRIQIAEGEGAINSAGSRSERPIAVQLTDETGRPLEGVAVSFRMPEEGPGGTFESGMKTEIAITSSDGRAAVHGIRWNRLPGPFQIRVTAAKGESRAGAICSQYISDTPAAKTGKSLRARGGGRKKWVAIAAIAAGGTAAGLAMGGAGKPQQPAQPPPVAPPTSIGVPTISIGRP